MSGVAILCGVDEAGRGPWAGPVCAAAVILAPDGAPDGLTDSKRLTPRQREELATEIRACARAYALGWADVAEIDAFNIRQATHLAMRRAVAALGLIPHAALIDGNDPPGGLPCPARTIIKGDLTEPAISAASILAKTARDALMAELCARHPGYGFSAHKGYGTPDHAQALARLGPCPQHRMSFAPVARAARHMSA